MQAVEWTPNQRLRQITQKYGTKDSGFCVTEVDYLYANY